MAKRKTWSSTLFTSDTPTAATYGVDRQRVFQGLHDALIDTDWTQTADTGQLGAFLDTGATTTTTFGYRIYKLNDEFSAESPVYMKLVFSVGISNAGWFQFPDLKISIGNGTDGSGNLISATPEREMYAAKATYSFTRTVTPNIATTSFAYSGGGISWVALNCGAIAGNKTASGVARGSVSGDGNWPLRFFAVCRPMDESGSATAHGACLLTADVPKLAYFMSGFNTGDAGAVGMRADFLSQGGGVTTSTNVSARVLPDLLKTEGLKMVAAPAYGLFSGVARRLSGIASVPAVSVSALDTVELAVGGVLPRLMISPHPGLIGFNRLDAARHAGLAIYGSVEFDTLLLAWDGVDV